MGCKNFEALHTMISLRISLLLHTCNIIKVRSPVILHDRRRQLWWFMVAFSTTYKDFRHFVRIEYIDTVPLGLSSMGHNDLNPGWSVS